MLSKNLLRLLFTVLFILLIVLIIIIQGMEIDNHQNSLVDNFLMVVSGDLKKDNKISKKSYSLAPNNLIFVLWLKNSHNNWKILLYDKKNIEPQRLKSPFANINPLCRVYQRKIDSQQFVVWVYKYNIAIFFTDIFLPLLIIIFVYLLILLLLEIFLHEKSEKFETLWIKDFKISKEFKNNFNFTVIYDAITLGISREKYLSLSLSVAKDYFKWSNCTIYLNNGHKFIDYSTQEVLDQKTIVIPQSGKQKGKFFLPLYPYDYTTLMGYLYFETENNFYISDILFFLKWVFSQRAEFIFFRQKEQQKYIQTLDDLLEEKDNAFVMLIEIDDREELSQNLKEVWSVNLDREIHNRLKTLISNGRIFKLYPFSYTIIGIRQDKNIIIERITNWIDNKENQHYKISKEYGDVSITYSVGIAFKNGRDIHSQTLINEARIFYQKAVENGGDQAIGN